ncbi:MAG: L,D-transpeptidase [Methylococcales bacterium]|nr:L,D-transpeptidase [Methylococcales bacterium]
MTQLINISIAEQQLTLIKNNQLIRQYSVSTAKNGVGQTMGSGCTPLGLHRIRAKIGAGEPLKSVFIGRRVTGEVYSTELAKKYPQRDWILSRILWLGGLEARKNRYGDMDTTWRYIYIHGCPDHLLQGKPESHGCIRMKNADIIELFEWVDTQTQVYIDKD